MKKLIILICLVVFLSIVTLGFFLTKGGQKTPPLQPSNQAGRAQARAVQPPKQVGDWRLLDFKAGDAAAAEVAGLHGKSVSDDETYIVVYESSSGRAKAWVSDGRTALRAQQLIDRMLTGIAAGGPFKVVGQLNTGRRIYELAGMGEKHYLYRRVTKVIWVSFSPSVPTAMLRDLLAEIR
ncbi:MAG: hypothetical protein Q8L35_01195 [Actinomycetota bacterium]|nr:hypothetical protein [Actinomycetota bacterium]